MASPRKTGRTPRENKRQRPGQVERLNVVQDIIGFRQQIRELARPNLFQVEINFPAKVEEIFQVNAADIPESQNNSTSSAEGKTPLYLPCEGSKPSRFYCGCG